MEINKEEVICFALLSFFCEENLLTFTTELIYEPHYY
jgi:hypothetical protein